MHEIIELRRKIHRHPELGYCEFETSKLVADFLESLGVQVTRGVAQTGVVGLIDNNSDRTLLFRADMDALPVYEENKTEYKSEIPGVMHACGHDVHTAILMGTARELVKRRNELNCNIKFVFQPAEETVGGALPMIELGVLENPHVDAALALHVWPDAKVGSVMLKKGGIMASPDNFKITIIGKGGHAAMPDSFVNPISIGAEVITALKNIKVNEPIVVTVGKFEAGRVSSVVPDIAEIDGTFRTLSNEMREWLPKEIDRITKEIVARNDAEYKLEIDFFYPPLINNSEMIDAVAKVANNIVQMEKPSMVGEDFAYFAQKVPSAMILLGCTNAEKGIQSSLHATTFDVDEDCIPIGVNLLADFAINF